MTKPIERVGSSPSLAGDSNEFEIRSFVLDIGYYWLRDSCRDIWLQQPNDLHTHQSKLGKPNGREPKNLAYKCIGATTQGSEQGRGYNRKKKDRQSDDDDIPGNTHTREHTRQLGDGNRRRAWSAYPKKTLKKAPYRITLRARLPPPSRRACRMAGLLLGRYAGAARTSLPILPLCFFLFFVAGRQAGHFYT